MNPKNLNLKLVLLGAVAVLSAMASPALADSTKVELYRWGNASSPKLDNIRPDELGTFQRGGQTWVEHDSGGISTYSSNRPGQKNVWRLPRGSSFPSRLHIVNDAGEHWLIEPAADMPMDEYLSLLRELQKRFEKLP